MINLNKSHTDLLDNIPLTKASRIKKETDYLTITSCMSKVVADCRKQNKGVSGGDMAKGLITNLIDMGKTDLSKDPFIFKVLEYLGYDHGMMGLFRRKFTLARKEEREQSKACH